MINFPKYTGYVYSLSCLKTKKIFYIGSCRWMLGRLQQHLQAVKLGKYKVHRYIAENSITPVIEEIEYIEFEEKNDLKKVEMFWIEQFRQWGFSLQNVDNLVGSHKRRYNIRRRGLIEDMRGL